MIVLGVGLAGCYPEGAAPPALDPDLNDDGVVNVLDTSLVTNCQGLDPATVCQCRRADADQDTDVDLDDLTIVKDAFGEYGYPVVAPDTTPPQITLAMPMSGEVFSESPIQVDGSLDEAAFSVTVNGEPAEVGAAPLAPFMAETELVPGANPITVVATDLACNESTLTVNVSLGEVDGVAPVASLTAPSQVQASTVIRATATAEDNIAVESVSFLVDGLEVKESTSPPYELSYNAPAEVGTVLEIQAMARDAAGNEGTASVLVTVVAAPDTEPPVVSEVRVPESGAPGSTVKVRAEVTDPGGIAEVRFTEGGRDLGAVTVPPYEVDLPIPGDAEPGSQLTIEVEAVDASLNTATAQANLLVTAVADTDPPSSVLVMAPLEALAGQQIEVTATAVDAGGILEVAFLVDGVVVGTDGTPPYTLPYTVAEDAAEGSQILFTTRAMDFADNAAVSMQAATRVVAPGAGLIAGEVYDDTTGLPLPGATVRLTLHLGTVLDPAPETTTDARGRYRFESSEGDAVVEISLADHTTALRESFVEKDRVNVPLDIRLTPLAKAVPIDSLAGGGIAIASGANLDVPAGALTSATALTLTPLSGQGLPKPLPLGWSPVVALHVGPEGEALNAALGVHFSGIGVPSDLVAAHFDPTTREWLRIASEVADDGVSVSLSGLGAVALVVPDTAPEAPVLPEPGEALAGVSPRPVPAAATAEILPSPKVIFLQAGARSEVTARLDSPTGLPSATAVEVDFTEHYDRLDGSTLVPEDSTQDVLVYQGASGTEARFVASPSQVFDPALLREGVISLAAHRRGEGPEARIVGAAGGTVASPDGAVLEIASGSLSGPTDASLESLDPQGLAPSDASFSPIAAVRVALGGAALATPAELSVPAPALLPADAQVLVARPVAVRGITHHELVGIAIRDNGTLSVGRGAGGLPLPGVDGEGRYLFAEMKEPVGFVSGQIAAGGVPPAGAVVSSGSVPFVSLTELATPAYIVAATLGNASVSGLDTSTGAVGGGAASLAAPGDIELVDLDLVSLRPVVVRTLPTAGSTDALGSAVVTLTFSRQMDPTTLTTDALRLLGGGVPIPGSVSPSPDGLSATFRPDEPLASEVAHTVVATTAIRDVFGNVLFGNQPDESFEIEFTTRDVTPPPRPDPGQIGMSMPDEDGVVTITGSLGTAEPGALVTARNETTGMIASIRAAADGSYTLRLPAQVVDDIVLVLADLAGNETTVSPGLFDSGEGTGVVGLEGGTLRLPDGSELVFEPGAFAERTPVTVERFSEAESPIPTPTDFQLAFAAGFEVDIGAAELLKPLEFRVPIEQDLPEGTQLLVGLIEDIGGELRLNIRETAIYSNGMAVVNSPPWGGIVGPLVKFLFALFIPGQNLSFVTGEVLEAPRIGVVTLEVPKGVEPSDDVAVVAKAIPLQPGVTVESLKVFRMGQLLSEAADEITTFVVDTTGAGDGVKRKVAIEPISASLVHTVFTVVNYALAGQQAQRWKAEAVFKKPGFEEPNPGDPCAKRSLCVAVQNATEIFVTGIPGNETSTASANAHLKDASVATPAVGAWVQVFNGLGAAYPAETVTHCKSREPDPDNPGETRCKAAGFVLPAAPGDAFLRLFDPLTGNGVEYVFTVPNTLFDFVDFGQIYVPKAFGDGQPPTIDIQVAGVLEPEEPFSVTITVTDNEGLDSLAASVNGTHLASVGIGGNTYDTQLQYTPVLPGEYTIAATVYDEAQNRTDRELIVRVSKPAGGQATANNEVSILPNSENVESTPGIYVDLELTGGGPLEPGVPLERLTGVDVHFETLDGTQIEVIGCTESTGTRLRVKPGAPLPLAKKLDLVVNDEKTSFTTAGLETGGELALDGSGGASSPSGGLNEGADIRDIALFRDLAAGEVYAYIADFASAATGLKVFKVTDVAKPELLSTMSLPARARALAVDRPGGRLAVAMGGLGELPLLRLYRIANPASPEHLATATLFPLAGQAVPLNVRIEGGLAYVGTVGAGLQVVDLGKLEDIAATPFAERDFSERNGTAAIIGGFRLPDNEAEPPRIGSAFDVTLGLPGLAVTGGSSNSLYVLSNTIPGFFGTILSGNGSVGSFFQLPFDVQRLSGWNNFPARRDVNADGVKDTLNLNIAAVSHGAEGFSLIDLSRPNVPDVLGTADIGSVFDLEILGPQVFTGDRFTAIGDPENPVAGGALSVKLENGQTVSFSSGGDVAIESLGFEPDGRERVLVASSDGSRTKLQVGEILLPARGRDWNIFRDGKYEPHVHPDTRQYLHTGDPVNPFTGEYTAQETDLVIRSRGVDFMFTRSYRSRNRFNGPLGHGWDHSYNDRLTVVDAVFSEINGVGVVKTVDRMDGSGRMERYERDEQLSNDGADVYTSPAGQFAELGRDVETSKFTLTFPDGSKRFYEQLRANSTTALEISTRRFHLARMEDRYGNSMELVHDERNRLIQVRDVFDRPVTFSYDSEDRLRVITDFVGRTITYRYDCDDNLLSVTGPSTDGFPRGKTTTYTYASGFPEFDNEWRPLPSARLNHNLLTVTDPKGQTYLTLTYGTEMGTDTFDRVLTQCLGDPDACTETPAPGAAGGLYKFGYTDEDGDDEVDKATTINRTGATTTRHYSSKGNLEKLDEPVTIDGVLTTLTTQFTYDLDGLMLSETTPRGVKTEYDYTDFGPRTRQGDLEEIKITPVGGGAARTWTYTPGPFGIPTEIKDPLGNITTQNVLPNGNVTSITHPTVTLADDTAQVLVERFSFGAFGELRAMASADGVVTRYEYDDAPNGLGPGYLKAVIEDTSDASLGGTRTVSGPRLNLRTDYTHDDVGNVESIKDPRGLLTELTVNELNQVVSSTDPRGTVSFVYDGNDNLELFVDALTGIPARTSTLVYDSLDRQLGFTESSDGLTQTYEFEYDSSENRTVARTPLGYEDRKSYDERSLPYEVRTSGGSPLPVEGLVLELVYDADENVIRAIDADAAATMYSYNGFNDLESTTDPNGNVTVFAYDARGLVIAKQHMADDGRLVSETLFERDELGRARVERECVLELPTHDVCPTYAETRLLYDRGDRIVEIIDPLGRSNQTEYDGLGRTVREVDASGNIIDTTFDATRGLDLDRVVEIDLDSEGNTTQTTTEFDYDLYGRLEESRVIGDGETTPSRTEQFVYDSADRLETRTLVGGTSTTLTYDGLGRLDTVTTAREVRDFTYDGDGRVSREEDAQGRGIDYSLDGRDRLRTAIYADGSAETFEYYPDGEMRSATDRAGNEKTFTYDDGNRLISTSIALAPGFVGVVERSFGYDGMDHLVSATSTSAMGTRTVGFTYDSRGVVLGETQGNSTVRSGFNLSAERISMQYPTGLGLSLIRDPAGRLSEVRDPSGPIVRAGYFGQGLISTLEFGNGTRGMRAFGPTKAEAHRRYESPADALQTSFEIRRDSAERITGVARGHQAGTGRAFDYTAEGWLSTSLSGIPRPLDEDAVDQSGNRIEYRYDSSGNLKERETDGGVESFATNALNQYETADGAPLGYDDNGNLTGTGSLLFTYDASGQLVRVRDAASGEEVARYEYDGLGRRTRETTPAGGEEYIYDGANLIAVLDSTGDVRREYIYLDGRVEPQSLRTTGGNYYFQRDFIGSTVALTDANGGVVERYEYDALGAPEIRDETGALLRRSKVGNDLLYAGARWYAATGLLQFGLRDYDPKLGRFLQPDPAGSIDGMNLYQYAGNEPVNFVDPTGLFRQASFENRRIGSMAGMNEELGLRGISLTDAVGLATSFFSLGRGVVGLTGRAGRRVFQPRIGLGDLDRGAASRGLGGAGRTARFGKKALTSAGEVVSNLARKVTRAPKALADAIGRGVRRIGKSCSFAPGTLVETSEGMEPIEDLEPGDLILARDELTKLTELREVVDAYSSSHDDVMSLGLVAPDGSTESLTTTAEHPFWEQNEGWTAAADLEVGESVLSAHLGWLRVGDIQWAPPATVYNLTVEDLHTYFVGEVGAWVHNDCPPIKGLTSAQDATLRKALRRLVKRSGLKKGRIVVQGSRAPNSPKRPRTRASDVEVRINSTTGQKKVKRGPSDIDIGLIVDEKTFDRLAREAGAGAKNTRELAAIERMIQNNGQLTTLALSRTNAGGAFSFGELKAMLLNRKKLGLPDLEIQFSVLRRGGTFAGEASHTLGHF